MGYAVTFGEIMMRLNPRGYERFLQADAFEVSYAGGEANVAVSLASFGRQARFVSKVPDNDIGQCAVNALRRYGVDTGCVLRGGERLGIYFVEKGASQRPSKVIYDRARSALSQARPEEFDWDRIFSDADWFHWTGITPALGGALPEICLDACRAARKRNIPVSCDLNYRKKLWSRERAREVMSELMPYVNVCIANEEDAKDVFGIEAEDSDVEAGRLNREGFCSVARQLMERFGFDKVAITLRTSLSASDNQWAGMLYTKANVFFSPTYPIHIVDRVGGGDSFAGGLIYSLLAGSPPQDAVDFAVAASCLKHTIEHDFNLASVQEVTELKNGNGTGRVQR